MQLGDFGLLIPTLLQGPTHIRRNDLVRDLEIDATEAITPRPLAIEQ
jgi:hypothetical protein